MIDLLPAVPRSGGKGGNSEDQLSAAKNIWKALDDMAEADPEQYKKFIQQQMQQAQDHGFQKPNSRPAVILTASVVSTSKYTAAIISLFENTQCPEPSETGKTRIPISAAKLPGMRIEFKERKDSYSVKASDGERCVHELDVHPSVVRCLCANDPDGFRKHVVERACRHVEKLSGMRLSRERRTLKILSEYASRGDRVAQVEKKATKAAVEAARGTALEGCDGLLAELGSLCIGDRGQQGGLHPDSRCRAVERNESGQDPGEEPIIEGLGSVRAPRKPLIEEL